MIILYIVTILITLFIIVSAARNKVLREIGFRNILRRKSTTLLVIFGSLIGTALISGSLTLGDSFNNSARISAQNTLGEIDAEVSINKSSPQPLFSNNLTNRQDPKSTLFTTNDLDKFSNSLDSTKVDGVLPVLNFSTSIVKGTDPNKDLSITGANIIAFTNEEFGSEDINFQIPYGETIISQEIADRLDLKPGDTLTSFNGIKNLTLEVLSINNQKGATAYTGQNGNIIVSPEFLRSEFNIPQGDYNKILISSKGGTFEPTYDATQFTNYLNTQADNNKPTDGTWSVKEDKAAKITGGNDFVTYAFLGVSIVGVIAGILLIINIYSMLAEERKSEMGTLRALALTRSKLIKTFIYEGYIYSMISSLLGVFVGVGVGYILLNSITGLANTAEQVGNAGRFNISFSTSPQSWLVSFCLGLLITFTTSYIASRRISKINIVSAIRNIPDEKNVGRTKWSLIKVIIQTILLVDFLASIVVGIILLKSNNTKFDVTVVSKESLGGYLIFLGVVFSCFILSILLGKLLSTMGKEKYRRLVVTILNIPPLLLSLFIGNIELFNKVFESLIGYSLLLLAGISIIITSTTIITYNIDLILLLIEKTIGRISSFNGIFKLALRYSGENRFRTGLTILMFALVLFLVSFLSVFKSTVDQQLERFLPKQGYDAFVQSPKNIDTNAVINNVNQANITQDISVYKSVLVQYKDINQGDLYSQFLDKNSPLFRQKASTTLFGINQHFIDVNPLKLNSRCDKFQNEDEVINAILNDSNYVLLTAQALGTSTYLNPPAALKPCASVNLNLNGKISTVIIAGYLDQTASQNYSIFQYGMIGNEDIFTNVLDPNYVDQYYSNNLLFKLSDNGKPRSDNLKTIQKKLIQFNLASGLFSIAAIFETASSFIKGAIDILQGFLSFALFVGIAGIAIIMVRSVNERRQQIGMLRSLGFQRRSVLLSFFLEASFIIFLGILIGIISGAVTGNIFFTARNNVALSAGASQQAIAQISVPYNELLLIGIAVYIVSIIFTLLPSYQASRLSPVEATNYLD